MIFVDRDGNRQDNHPFSDLSRLTESGWAVILRSDDPWRIAIKINGQRITRAALATVITHLEGTAAGDIRIEDMTTRVPQSFDGWTRIGGLQVLKSLMSKLRFFRAMTGDPAPLSRGAKADPVDLSMAEPA